MKKIIIIVSLLITVAQAYACDICGCGAGSNYLGILPEFSRNIIGLRYRYNGLQTHISGGTVTYLTTDEVYRSAEIWGGFNISRKFRLMAVLPYHFIEKENQGQSIPKNGLGDMSVTGFYQLLNKRQTVSGNRILVQSLWVGGGLKLPTGKYNPQDKSPGADNANLFQLGTGSVDFTANAMYDLRLQDAGISTTLQYKTNTMNSNDYRYGNKWNASAQLYYKFRLGHGISLAPNIGMQYENAMKDKDGKYEAEASGGYLLTAATGVELVLNRLAIGSNWNTPLNQNLANGFVKAKNRLMVHFAVTF